MAAALKRLTAITNQLTATAASAAMNLTGSEVSAAGDAKDTKTAAAGSLVPAAAPQSTRSDHINQKNGGLQIAKALLEQRVKVVYTLTGGHIAPMLVGCNQVGIRVVDVRDEVTTCFAADATARMTGVPGVAMVTAGPGLTNTITAVKNAQLAESPIVVFGGATAMILKGRGALQDIDQLALMKPHCKLMISIRTVRDIIPSIRKAFRVAQEGVPGPVFLETPIEILWPEALFTEMIGGSMGDKKKKEEPFKLNMASVMAAAQKLYLQRYAKNVFRDGLKEIPPLSCVTVPPQLPNPASITAVHAMLLKAQRPVIVVGSQAIRASTCFIVCGMSLCLTVATPQLIICLFVCFWVRCCCSGCDCPGISDRVIRCAGVSVRYGSWFDGSRSPPAHASQAWCVFGKS